MSTCDITEKVNNFGCTEVDLISAFFDLLGKLQLRLPPLVLLADKISKNVR